MSSLLNLKEAKQLFYGGNELDRVYYNGALIWDRPSEAMWRLWNETQGLAIDFTDGFYYNSTARFGTVAIKDTTTPANNFDSVPDDKISYPGASVKYTRDMDGVTRYRPNNLYANPAAPANQSVTVMSGATYAMRVTGSVSIALSGAHSTTITAASGWVDFTAGTATLTCGSTTGSGTVHLRRTPSSDVYTDRITLPYEWGPTNLFASPSSPATQTITGLTVGRSYTVYVEGAGSIALSGAGNGTATASAPRTFKASATSVVCTVSGSLTVVHVREAFGTRQESARTNLALRSNDFTTTWGASNTTVSSNALVAPDGTTTADSIVNTAVAGTHSMLQTITVAASTTYTLSCFLKLGTIRYVSVALGATATGAGGYAVFDLQAGTITQSGVSAGGGTFVSASIEAVTNGWYRCSVVASQGTTSVFAFISPCTTGTPSVDVFGRENFVGTTAQNFGVWGAQLEVGSTASSPIETFGSTVTRAADNPQLATSAFPYNDSAGTILVSASVADTSSGTDYRAFSLNDGTGNNRVFMLASGTGANVQVFSGGGNQASLDPSGSYVVNTPARIAACYAVNDFAAVLNGGSILSDVSGSVPVGINSLSIGSDRNGSHWNGHIREILYVPRRMSNAELQALTAA